MVNIAGEEEDGSGGVDIRSVIEELEKVSEEELDFRVEAEHTRRFRECCIEDESIISCPSIIEELITERILTMTFVDGYSVSKRERVEADGYDRLEIGKAIVENYLHQVLDAGMFHGDPHQGNIMLENGIPYWIDFGMIGHVSEQSINIIQEIVFSLIQKDIEALTNAALSMGRVSGKLNKSKLMDDIDGLIERYVSAKNLSDMDVGGLMTDLTGLLSAHHITVPGEYTMLVRSLVTMEGVLEAFCPELNLFELLTKKMLQRAKENFDIREKITADVESLTATGLRTARLPSLAFDVLRNLVKGRMKINFEITGYEEPLRQLNKTVKNVVLAVFSCVLFSGSCTLCTTDITPQTNGVPVVALLGFVVSVALGIYTVLGMVKK